jgi:hypothetical protein
MVQHKEIEMIDFYFIELAKLILSLVLDLLQAHAHIASALLPW